MQSVVLAIRTFVAVSDSTICIGVARGVRGGVGWRAIPLSPLQCGQLTRCFSAVAELLVVPAETGMGCIETDRQTAVSNAACCRRRTVRTAS